jgi:4-amino-4-deoxy-L-arabinose transferase-like glycosyltransferase
VSAAGRRNYWDSLGETQTIVSLVFLYCAVHFLLRFMLSPNLNGAEAEQALFSQSLQWGYRAGHPPLATWLSWSLLAASRNSRLALFLLHEAILGIGVVAYFAAARRVIENARTAALAALFLLAAFGIGWLLHLGSFESSLLATMCALYLWADSRALVRETYLDYALLGAATGLGVLSSYVFLVLPFAMSVALALTPELRARLRLQPLLVAALVALAIVGPYFAFAPDALTVAASGNRMPALGEFAFALIAFALPAALLFVLLYPRALAQIASPETPPGWLRFLSITMAVAAIASAAAV